MRGLFLAVLLLLVATCAAALWWSGAMAEPTPTDQFVPATQRDGAAAADAR